MTNNELFPLRVASGQRFCNRKKERKLLKELLAQKRPTTLISPRRYGKTSLAYKVTEEMKYPFCVIDFLTVYNDQSICSCIISGISELVSKIMPANMKPLKLLENCFRGVKVSILSKLLELEFVFPIEKIDPCSASIEALKGLDMLVSKLNKTVVVFIDEFQRVLETEKGGAIQGSIRSVAQVTKNIAFLFSGSSCHMLLQAFDDPNQPLYTMCEKMFLGRIAANEYIPYIQEAAIIRWSQKLNLAEITRITELSENHPLHVNFLCGKLWQKDNPPTNTNDVDAGWQECLISEERRLVRRIRQINNSAAISFKGNCA